VDAPYYNGDDNREFGPNPDDCDGCDQTPCKCEPCQRCGDTRSVRWFGHDQVCEDCYTFLLDYEPKVEADL
jgi:hypothetical protein